MSVYINFSRYPTDNIAIENAKTSSRFMVIVVSRGILLIFNFVIKRGDSRADATRSSGSSSSSRRARMLVGEEIPIMHLWPITVYGGNRDIRA